MNLTERRKVKEKAEQENYKEAIEKHPELKEYSKRIRKKYDKAIHKYKDLEELPIKLAVIGFDFREEQLKQYTPKYCNEIASARGPIDINIGGFNQIKKIPIPILDIRGNSIGEFKVVLKKDEKGKDIYVVVTIY